MRRCRSCPTHFHQQSPKSQAVTTDLLLSPTSPQVARKLVILEGELERSEERAEVAER